MSVVLTGFTTALALIAAIGAQNAFIIRQGLARQHVLLICLMFSCADAFLILVGVYGLAYLKDVIPSIEPVMKYFGAAFLLIYGAKSFWNMFMVNNTLDFSEQKVLSIKATILLCLAFTWLNPHVYLDTVILLGSIANQYPKQELNFAIGALGASFFLFFSIGYGAILLRPLFVKPVAWKILDGITGTIMWVIAIKLLI